MLAVGVRTRPVAGISAPLASVETYWTRFAVPTALSEAGSVAAAELKTRPGWATAAAARTAEAAVVAEPGGRAVSLLAIGADAGGRLAAVAPPPAMAAASAEAGGGCGCGRGGWGGEHPADDQQGGRK